MSPNSDMFEFSDFRNNEYKKKEEFPISELRCLSNVESSVYLMFQCSNSECRIANSRFRNFDFWNSEFHVVKISNSNFEVTIMSMSVVERSMFGFRMFEIGIF